TVGSHVMTQHIYPTRPSWNLRRRSRPPTPFTMADTVLQEHLRLSSTLSDKKWRYRMASLPKAEPCIMTVSSSYVLRAQGQRPDCWQAVRHVLSWNRKVRSSSRDGCKLPY